MGFMGCSGVIVKGKGEGKRDEAGYAIWRMCVVYVVYVRNGVWFPWWLLKYKIYGSSKKPQAPSAGYM